MADPLFSVCGPAQEPSPKSKVTSHFLHESCYKSYLAVLESDESIVGRAERTFERAGSVLRGFHFWISGSAARHRPTEIGAFCGKTE